jgi:hypothetical protein
MMNNPNAARAAMQGLGTNQQAFSGLNLPGAYRPPAPPAMRHTTFSMPQSSDVAADIARMRAQRTPDGGIQ